MNVCGMLTVTSTSVMMPAVAKLTGTLTIWGDAPKTVPGLTDWLSVDATEVPVVKV
jgi:hypothetical protein